MKTEVEELLALAKQHQRGAVHTRDLGNPCAECGQPGPSTMTYCERCMVAKLAKALERQAEIMEPIEQAGRWLAAELERYKEMVHKLGMEGLAKENAELRARLQEET